jgi:Domain of unknown function (DUF4149)
VGTSIAAARAVHRRDQRDAADPVGAVGRNQIRALMALLVTALWAGAATIVITTVAPAAFRVLPTRAIAGSLIGQVLPVVFITGMIAGVLGFVLTTRAAPRAMLRRIGTIGTLLGCGVAQVVIGPKIAALREQIGPSVEALAAADPMRVAFGRLHAFSVLWLGIALLCALVTVVASMLAVRDAASATPCPPSPAVPS